MSERLIGEPFMSDLVNALNEGRLRIVRRRPFSRPDGVVMVHVVFEEVEAVEDPQVLRLARLLCDHEPSGDSEWDDGGDNAYWTDYARLLLDSGLYETPDVLAEPASEAEAS